MDNYSDNNNYQNPNNNLNNQANNSQLNIGSDNNGSANVQNNLISETDLSQDSYNYVSGGQGKRRGNGTGALGGIFKIVIILIIPVSMTVMMLSYFKSKQKNLEINEVDKASGVVMRVPMIDSNWKDIGTVFEPLITIPIKTQNSYQDWEFLLDSGAVISSLPRDWADKMGKDIDKMKRSVFRGFGGKVSFAYQGEMTVLLGEEDIEMPVVFTEVSSTKSLIGRKGFFQDYSVYFNHRDKVIEIIR